VTAGPTGLPWDDPAAWAEPGLDPEGPEWDDLDSAAHQDRVESGEITQDGAPREPGMDEWGQPEAGG
jgi:hypothetical protein